MGNFSSKAQARLLGSFDQGSLETERTSPTTINILQQYISPARVTTALTYAMPPFHDRETLLGKGGTNQRETTAREEARTPFQFGSDMLFEFTFSVPFQFGCNMLFEFTFSVPERTVANEPFKREERSVAADQQVPDRDTTHARHTQKSLGRVRDARTTTRRQSHSKEHTDPDTSATAESPHYQVYGTVPYNNHLSAAIEVLEVPWKQNQINEEAYSTEGWRSRNMTPRAKTMKDEAMVKASNPDKAIFRKQEVSRVPKNQWSALTEQLRAQEQEEEDEEEKEDTDEVNRSDATLYSKVTRALDRMSIGNYAASQTLALSLNQTTGDGHWDKLKGCWSREEELVYLPQGLMGRIRKRGLALSVPLIQIICCNCAGVSSEAEFHCVACGLHTLCKDCSVGIPMSSFTQLENEVFTSKDRELDYCGTMRV
ncbi:hypothetical protein BR93DRAFT_568166 [Coniochaeta sp. PMI_546]|nr:hypothetical protein BR93DRAFT_568166 [Coniochaeta sp. PMI_546]